MAPRRQFLRKKCRNFTRSSRSAHTRIYQQFTGQASPGNSAVVGWTHLPSIVQDATFKIHSIIVTFSPRDVATANSLQTGPALLQCRQIDPTGKLTLRSSPIFHTNTTAVRHINVDRVEYVAPWRGDALISLDCICPTKGYEVGFIYTMVVIYDVTVQPKPDACPTFCSEHHSESPTQWDEELV